MAHEILCPNGHKLQVTEAHFGKQVRCPTCGEPFIVPDLSAEAPAPESPQPEGPAAAPSTAPPPRRRAAEGTPFERFAKVAGHPLLVAGLVLVLFARGCDSLGSRSVASATAQATMARQKFQQQWERKRASIEQEIEAIRQMPTMSADDRTRAADLQKQLTDLRTEQQKEQSRLTSTTWRDLDNAARNAGAGNLINGYWYEAAFLLGTIALAVGLMAVGFTGQGAERWICLTMLAIITFSIYIGGIAWISSLINAIMGAVSSAGSALRPMIR